MLDLKLKVHTSFIGHTGFNNHAQSFFTALSDHVPLEIRNFTIGKSWKGYSDEPHNGEPYLTDRMKHLLVEQSLWGPDGNLTTHPIYTRWLNPGTPSVNLVLNETNHHYWYQDYSGYTIGYSVWESTLQPPEFFDRLLKFNEVWVPSKWQRDCTIDQGFPADRIFVIPEGVDDSTFFPETSIHPLTSGERFTFFLVGRWDYRKSIKEIIETFTKTFSKGEPVDLILSVDNPFSGDGLETTENRLKHYGLEDDRLKIVHLPPRDEYVSLLKSADVFVSCARSEGWNLPLIEAMACGTPSIYSECSGQLEFAQGRGIPVKITGEKPASLSDYNHFNQTSGNYYEPDFNDLGRAMRFAYENHKQLKERALAESVEIRKEFNWSRVAKLAADHLASRSSHIKDVILNDIKPLTMSYTFINGAKLEITGGIPTEYDVEFIDRATGKIEHQGRIKNNMWIKTSRQYYTDWLIRATDVKTKAMINQGLNLEGERVYVALESASLGDTLAWFPAAEEFRKKHKCQLICSTFHNHLFVDNYPEITFINPGEPVHNVTAMYSIGWYYNDKGEIDLAKNPREPKNQPMQKTAFDILGLDWIETVPKISFEKRDRQNKISIAIHATCQAKYWNNPTGWQQVIDWCTQNGYEVVILSREEDGFMGNSYPNGARKLPHGPLNKVMEELSSSKAFIGIGSGLSWLSWATETPTILISGFSDPYTETQSGTIRVSAPAGKCSGCFNSHKLDPADWNWCPVNKNTERMFECSRSISAERVIEELKTALESYR